MNIAVCVKSAIDEGELRSDSSGNPLLQGAATKMSTFDRNAVEEAVRKKEAAGAGSTVTVFTVGSQDSRKTIKEALAMGADRAVLVVAETATDALGTGYLLSKCIASTSKGGPPPDLVICSEGTSDTYQGQVGPMLAEFLGLPLLAYVRKLEISGGTARAEQSFDEGIRVSEAQLPAVVTVVSEANEPRYPTLIQIMQASKKPIEEVQATSLAGPDRPGGSSDLIEIKVQAMTRKRMIFEGPPEETARKLIDALRQEGVVKV